MKTAIIKGIFLSAALLTSTWLSGSDKDKNATPPKLESKLVDSGSFGIYLNGKRIGTETFKIEQRPDFSIATAELKVDDGTTKATQTAEMQITPMGDLHSYVWHSILPVKEETSVEPNNQLLVEHVVPADTKKVDVPHLLPVSTAILDDNFFSQREILLWRYLATGCVPNKEKGLMCGPSTFVVLVPHQHLSENATLELMEPEKLTIKGVEKQLRKVALKTGDPQHVVVLNDRKESDNGQWLLWVDEQYKVVKMTFSGTNVEIIRD